MTDPEPFDAPETLDEYDPHGSYAVGDIMLYRGRPWRSLAYYDATEADLAPDENFRFWEMLPLSHDSGKTFGYCFACNGRTVNVDHFCCHCGADYRPPKGNENAQGATPGRLFERLFGKRKKK